ncbi:hypothetical protein AYO45_01365 [Gammaproteobacteria bacterium SCGC AG-212-F23]|nr:hypothetical protein AYO45_01365 [Gammaproteobacteria bacterium SCGC AG-212-F23]
MLTQIYVSHLATIDETNLELTNGTTALTGETGAGKSILIDAIQLSLGDRATADIVRQGQEKAEISVTFDIQNLPEARAWLQNYELDNAGSHECILRRSISRDGRSRSYINGMPTTLQPLRELGELLISIHGQHEHQTLLKPDKQRELLDHYAGHFKLLSEVRDFADKYHCLNNEMLALQKNAAEFSQRSEFLSFQLRELEELQLQPDEFQALDLEHKQLSHADELLQNVTIALDTLAENEEFNALKAIHQALQVLAKVQHVDPKIIGWMDSMQNAIIHMSDAESELRRYLDHINSDPERLQFLENRISKMFDLARKHKVSPQELYDFQTNLFNEFSSLQNSDERLHELQKQLQLIEKNYMDAAQKLSASRKKYAKKLETEITMTIRDLALPKAEFHIQFEPQTSAFSTDGLDKIIFQIKTNVGQLLQPLAKVASGGELSRIGLAIHVATAGQHTTPTLIFDEVDTGISGSTAEIVGKLLKKLGSNHQVLCITHLPQVAAQAHHHLLVEKFHDKNATHTRIQRLNEKEKIQELARMLGGVKITATTLAHAREMMEG